MNPVNSVLDPVLIAGPTAVGKSEVALLLAERIGGEIISVDSMQVYRGLDIGTAKPTAEEQSRVPHHLIDVLDLTAPFDAAQFVELARKAVAEIQSRGHVPIFCGGTGLYFKAYLEGLGEAPPSDPQLRAELEQAPLPDLLDELARRDPATYEAIDRQNPRRVVRALEVIRLTGKKFSEQRSKWTERGHAPPSPPQCGGEGRGEVAQLSNPMALSFSPVQEVNKPSAKIFGLFRSTNDLHARINLRVDEMFRRGLVVETEHLLKHGLAGNRTAMQALGYRQVVEHLRGERSLAETIELVKIKTRQFAKRQMTWFRRQLNPEWIEAATPDIADQIAARIKSASEQLPASSPQSPARASRCDCSPQ